MGSERKENGKIYGIGEEGKTKIYGTGEEGKGGNLWNRREERGRMCERAVWQIYLYHSPKKYNTKVIAAAAAPGSSNESRSELS